jgi:hypothetical protein
MKKMLLILCLILLSPLAHAGGGGGKSPDMPAPPPPPAAPQTPQDPNVSPAMARDKARRNAQGGQSSTFLTDGANLAPEDVKKTKLGGNTLLGG